MVEMLKQGVNAPIQFQKQVVMMYAGINGYLDNLDPSAIIPFETALYEKLDTTHSALQEQIISDKKLNDDIEAGMKKVIEETVEEVK